MHDDWSPPDVPGLEQAWACVYRGDYRAALAVAYPAVVRVEADPSSASSEDWQHVAVYALATAYTGEPDRAVAHADAALHALQAMHGPYDEATMAAQRALAVAQQAAGEHTAALNTIEAVHALSRRMHGEHATLTLLAAADLAVVLHHTGRCDDATGLLQPTVDAYVGCYGHDATAIRMLARLGGMTRDCGDFDHAHRLLGEARRLAQAHHPGDRSLVAAVTALARARAAPDHHCTAVRHALAGEPAPAPPARDEAPAGDGDGGWLAAMREPGIHLPAQPRSRRRPSGTSTPTIATAAGSAAASGATPAGHAVRDVEPAGHHEPGDAGPAARRRVGVAMRVRLPRPGKDVEESDLIATVRGHGVGLRQVSVVNPKGGAGKTVATLMLGLTFGRARGGFVLAWDNNETQGTLGMRAQRGEHGRTVRDLLRDLRRFADGQGRVGELEGYVRAQDDAMFDVLASDESAAAGAMLTAAAFRSIRDVVARFYRLLIVDTGNNVRAENWQAALDATDQLVIALSGRDDSAQSAARLLDHLDRTGRGAHVQRAVAVLTLPPRGVRRDIAGIEEHFGQRCRCVLRVPYDRHLDTGAPVAYTDITPASRRAWLRVAAAVAAGL